MTAQRMSAEEYHIADACDRYEITVPLAKKWVDDRKKIITLERALATAETALKDWQILRNPEEFSNAERLATETRISKVGLKAYIATARADIEKSLE